VLKGAMLLATWFDEPRRATRDEDLLGFGDPAPDGLTDGFADDPGKQRQWDAFARGLSGGVPELRIVIRDLRQGLSRLFWPR
jgi:hypothetical protein